MPCILLVALVAPVNRKPTRLDQHLALRLERLALDPRDARGDEKFRRWIKDGEEPFHDEVVHFQFLFLERGWCRLEGGDDRKVIGDLRVVEHLFVAAVHPVVLENVVGNAAVVRLAKRADGFLNRSDVVLRKTARVGSRIGQHLVTLVQRLRYAERVARREPKPSIGLALQRGQVKEHRGRLFRRLALLGNRTHLAVALGVDPICLALFPDALCPFVGVVRVFFESLVEPPPRVLPGLGLKRDVYLPVIFRNEGTDFLLAIDHHGERRGLHPADRCQIKAAALGVERRHRSRAVDAHEPVSLAPAASSICQRHHRFVGSQIGKALANGVRRHRLQPKPRDGLLRHFFLKLLLRVLDDVAENQFSLPAGVTGIDDSVDVLCAEQAHQHLQPRLALGDRLEIKVGGDMGQFVEGPLAALDVLILRNDQLQQVAHCGGNKVFVVLKKVL